MNSRPKRPARAERPIRGAKHQALIAQVTADLDRIAAAIAAGRIAPEKPSPQMLRGLRRYGLTAKDWDHVPDGSGEGAREPD